MKYFLFALIFIPMYALAHTSDERYVDGYIVDLSTAPVAPWVNEKMGMSFVFRDPITGVSTTTVLRARMSIDALMRANNKLQEVVFESEDFPVLDGGFVTSHVFTEEGTYDIHLLFVDNSGKEHLAGFRKQVRSGGISSRGGIDAPVFFLTIIIIAGLGFASGRLYRKS